MGVSVYSPSESPISNTALGDSVAVEYSTTTAGVGRGRLQRWLDPGSLRTWRGAVGDGVVAGSARVDGRPVCVWTQDAGYLGGSLGAAGGETIAQTIKRADRAGVPVIGFPDSGGARLQEGVNALSAYGAIFRAQALARVPQITVVDGVCAGGAAYSPALGDFVVLVGPHARMFLTGPKVVEKATGEQVNSEDLGGPRVHTSNGVAHLVAEDDRSAAELLSELLSYLPAIIGDPLPHRQAASPPAGSPADHLPADMRCVYDIRDVVTSLADGGRHLELAARWAPNMVTTFIRLDGRAVGIVANQPRHLGGTIDSAASEKGTWFVDLCDRFGLPIVVLVDTPGFLPGTRQERAGVIRHGASFLRAFARATTLKITVTLRQAYGGAHIVMNSRELGADLTLAWPGAQIGIMGARQAVAITERRAIAEGADVAELAERYASRQLAVDVAAERGLIDEVVSPCETRGHLVRTLELFAGSVAGSPCVPVEPITGNDCEAGYEDETGARHVLL